VTALPSLPFENFALFFHQWTRQAQVRQVSARAHVLLAIEGVPPHAWDRSTVEHLLGTSCAVDELAPDTVHRVDMGLFRLSAWTTAVEGIPPVRALWVPEPRDESWRSIDGPQPVRRIPELGMLEYQVLIHVTRLEEFVPLGTLGAGPGSSGRRPGHEGANGGAEGQWRSRNLPWTSGTPDPRGSFAGRGSGGGHGDVRRTALPVDLVLADWQLPPIGGRGGGHVRKAGVGAPGPALTTFWQDWPADVTAADTLWGPQG
jgi:hypothetical protein